MAEQDTNGTGGFKDRLLGKAKQVVGGALGDRDLALEGELQEEKVDAAKTAAVLENEAEQREEAARIAAAKQENELERQRLETEVTAAEREERLERERAAAEQRVESEFAAKEAEAEREAKARLAAAEAAERSAHRAHGEAVVDIARTERAADQAEATADVLDAAADRP